MNGFSTEIRTFYSLKELREGVEKEATRLRIMFEDYSLWLGTLLRSPESAKRKEWAKKATELQKVLKSGNRKNNAKKRGKKNETSTDWVQFKELMLSADDFGEAEMLFEAVEGLRNKTDRLEKAKNSIGELERYGLGKETVYVTFINDGVPEKVVFKPKEDFEAAEKFQFEADLVTEQT